MKRITICVIAALMLCGCGQQSVNIKDDYSSSPTESSVTSNTQKETADKPTQKSSDTDTAVSSKKDSDKPKQTVSKKEKSSDKGTDKNNKNNKNTDSDKKKSESSKTNVSSKNVSSSADVSSKSETVTQTSPQSLTTTYYYYDDNGNMQPTINVEPEKIHQFIMEQPPLEEDPEPPATYVNEYEDVKPSERIDISWFDDCMIIGDSITYGLSMYNDSTGAFGNAKFVCAGSLSYSNSQWAINAPGNVHPYYNGRKILLENAGVVTGAKKAIISLGMNDIGIWGPQGTIEQARSLLRKIRAKSPDLDIYLETVTPMVYGCQKARLNNASIRDFNSRLVVLAEEEGCHYLNSYDAFADSNGNLPFDLCSDPYGMGIHFTRTAYHTWQEFLFTNIKSASGIETETETDTDTNTVSQEITQSDTDSENVSESSQTEKENSDNLDNSDIDIVD